MSLSQTVITELKSLVDPEKKEIYPRFFKTGKGEYGEGDIFWGITTPDLRQVAKKYFQQATFQDLEKLITSKIHEQRSVALMMLTNQYARAAEPTQKQIFDFYLEHTQYINNWDLVDLSCYKIVGEYLLAHPEQQKLLTQLAHSTNMWEQRIAIVSTFALIRQGQLELTLQISLLLLDHSHDLIHKAVGWMLREVGKKNQPVLEKFIRTNYSQIPRTALRYAIERFNQSQRLKYLKGDFS